MNYNSFVMFGLRHLLTHKLLTKPHVSSFIVNFTHVGQVQFLCVDNQAFVSNFTSVYMRRLVLSRWVSNFR